MVEALYFIIATVVITGFGVVYAKGGVEAHGPLGMVSLPLIAVGAFAIWSLALLHVLPPERPAPVSVGKTVQITHGPPRPASKTARRVSMTGFYLVVVAHLTYALLLIGQDRMLLAGAILLLTILLLVCSMTEVHLPNKRRRDALLGQTSA